MTFACLSAANVHYEPFGELQEGSSPTLQITTRSVIVTHYNKYGKLFESSEDKPMLNNDVIADNAEDVGKAGDAGKAKNARMTEDIGKARDVRKVENEKDGSDTKNVRKAGQDIEDARDNKAAMRNNGVDDGRD